MPARTHKIRVMIADDHAILRAGLRMLVNAQADMEVVSEAPDGEKAVQTARETRPDVALLDLTMPRVGGMKALQEMARDCREIRVLVLTMHDDPAYLRSALAAGASGYLLKRAVDAELIAAIRAVHRGGIFVDPRLANILVQDVLAKRSTKAGPTRPVNILSRRELQVLRLVARGYTSAEIAKQIFVGVKTIETYRSRFAEKLGLRNRSDVIRFAVQMGLLTPETLESEPGGSIEVAVIDDGCGFDAKAVAVSSHRLGIHSMRERAAMLGGTVSFISQRKGTKILVQVPIAAMTPSP